MQGEKDKPELRGMIPKSFEHIFSHIANSRNEQYLVRAAFLEIYNVLDFYLFHYFYLYQTFFFLLKILLIKCTLIINTIPVFIYQEEIRDMLNTVQTKLLELKERPDTGIYV